MKFSRIAAIVMFAVTLTGTVPAQAGAFEWVAGLFAEDKPKARSKKDAAAHQKNAKSPRGRNGKRGNRNRGHRTPAQTPAPKEPKVRTVNDRTNVAQIKRAITRNAGLIAVGIALSCVTGLLLNENVRTAIQSVLDAAKPVQGVNELFKNFHDTAKGVKDAVNSFFKAAAGKKEKSE